MPNTRRTAALVSAATATLCLSPIFAVGAQAASKPSTTKTTAAKTVTACVNKKTGATKVLLGSKAKKKCAKGWTKVTWAVAGKTGAQGKAGANGANGASGKNGADGKNAALLVVRDNAGTVLGTYAGLNPLALYPIYVVLAADGGFYNYFPDGELAPSLALFGGGALFLDAGCTGTAYLNSGSAGSSLLSLVIGPARVVFRQGIGFGSLGVPRVWKYTTSTTTVPAVVPTFYQLDQVTGACAASLPGFIGAPVAGNALIALEPTPAPPDGVGPLSVG